MNSLDRSPSGPQGPSLRQGDLDAVLKNYFQNELPSAWPELNPTTQNLRLDDRISRRSRSPIRSRGVLAASIVVLLLGQLWLSGAFSSLSLTRFDHDPGRIEATKRNSQTRPRQGLPAAPKSKSTSRLSPRSDRALSRGG
jgi:hypothetical protein